MERQLINKDGTTNMLIGFDRKEIMEKIKENHAISVEKPLDKTCKHCGSFYTEWVKDKTFKI